MRLLATDFVGYYRPEPCANRVYLRQQGVPEAEPSMFDKVLARLGMRHEREHLARLGPYMDLSTATEAERIEKTKAAIAARCAVLYQPGFCFDTILGNANITIVGKPDFLLLENDEYVIRDSKLSRQIDDEHDVEILRQLQLYGFLYEKTTGRQPKRLEVHNGKGDITTVLYDGGVAALRELEQILGFKSRTTEQYEPVGWSKCSGCGYGDRCMKRAEDKQDVALLSDVDQNLARALHDRNVCTYADLRRNFDVSSLSNFKRPWGDREQKVGKKAAKILVNAEVMETGREKVLAQPAIPDCPNYVMLDLEGLPPQQDELEKIYLWGMQVYGQNPGEFLAATAAFGADGDKQAWFDFLDNAQTVLTAYGDIRFVHWAPYERVKIDRYIARYGDPSGVADRVKRNLLDLLPITKASVVLPIPSYSLKVVEEHIGFKRTQEEYGGDWAMAIYIEAVETNDEERRAELLNKIRQYNQEDLAATWAVLQWLRSKTP